MSRKWQLQEAKNRLSEVVDLALESGPQTVTRHGKEVVVVVSKADWEKRQPSRRARGTIVPFLSRLAFKGADLPLGRAKDVDREVDL